MSELYTALVKFQGEMKPVPKEAVNPHYKSNFADLSGIIQAASPLLAKNGLGFLQTMRVDGERNILQTKIIHASGQSELSEIIIPANNDPQKLGALITYLKRYSLQAALGIPAEDDDAESVAAPMRKEPPTPGRGPAPAAGGDFTRKEHWDELAGVAKNKGVRAPFCKTMTEYREAMASLMAMPDKQ